MQKVLHCHAAELCEGDTEELTALSVPEDTEDCCAVVKRSQLITSALIEGLQTADDTIPVDI